MRALAATLCLALALTGSSCERESRPASGAASELQKSEALVGQVFPGADLLLHVAHRGLRRVSYRAPGGWITFRERITTDGQGRFSIEPVEALTGTIMDWGSFELLQRAREGLVFRYRDFALRDAGLFERNWRWTGLGPDTVAGRPCERYRVERTAGAPALHEVWIDQVSGILLASRQFDAQGVEFSSMEYESLDLAPDLSGVAWHEPANQERELDWTRGIGDQVDDALLQPRLLPEGYALRAASTVEDGSRRWLKLTFVDGVETLFFLQALSSGPEARTGTDAGMDWTAGEAPAAGQVVVFAVGATTAAQATIGEHRLIAIGKVAEAELLDMIESALP